MFFGGLTSKEVSCSTLEVPSLEPISSFFLSFFAFFPYFCSWGYHRPMGQIPLFWMLFWRIFFCSSVCNCSFCPPLGRSGLTVRDSGLYESFGGLAYDCSIAVKDSGLYGSWGLAHFWHEFAFQTEKSNLSLFWSLAFSSCLAFSSLAFALSLVVPVLSLSCSSSRRGSGLGERKLRVHES